MATPRTKTSPLTPTVVTKALREGAPVVLKDTGSLSLKITGKNRGSWIYRGRVAGTNKTSEIVFGYAPELTLAAARQQRDRVRLQFKDGVNLNEQKKAKQEEERIRGVEAGWTFEFVTNEYFRRNKHKWSPKFYQTQLGRVNNHMAELKDMHIAELKRLQHLKPVIDKLLDSGKYKQAKLVSELLSRIMEYACNTGYIELSPATRLNRLVPTSNQDDHLPAVLDDDSAASLFQRIWVFCDEGRRCSSVIKAALKMSCYLPVRNGNLINAQWSHIDWKRGVWNFPKTKNGKSYTMPLTSQITALLKELQEYKVNQWCFPSWAKAGHISNTGMAKALEHAGVPGSEHCLHGFRSSFRTIAGNHGLSTELCERLLFHVVGNSVRRAYDRAQYLSAIGPALQWWNDTVDALRQGDAAPELPKILRELYN